MHVGAVFQVRSQAAVPLHRERGSGDSQMSVKSLATASKLEVVIKVIKILELPVVLVYGNYFSLTNCGDPKMIQYVQFMEVTGVFYLGWGRQKVHQGYF